MNGLDAMYGIERACSHATVYLLSKANEQGYWQGRLSSSAVANAVAVFALAQVDAEAHEETIRRGLRWLVDHANPDGGWGDTESSPSNLSATLLAWSALAVGDGSDPGMGLAVRGAEAWLIERTGCLHPAALALALRRRYGKDHTFSVPILALCALAGRLGPNGFAHVAQLPFELASVPHEFYRSVRLSVVSYAVPALLAIGLLRHRRLPSRNLFLRVLRNKVARRVVGRLAVMQPTHGGFQDSAALTGFIVMGLAGSGEKDNTVVRRGVEFLVSHIREEGTWPIDTNLATWLTSLSVRALYSPRDGLPLSLDRKRELTQWFLGQQHLREHPMTHSPPGGWGWTNEAGGMPDADDTASVLVALRRLGVEDGETLAAGRRALLWLMNMQNLDGGMPTFCRGWSRLDFDRSCPAVTAAATQAFGLWRPLLPEKDRKWLDKATRRCLAYLKTVQASDGSWLPLWFGNQFEARERNPVFGTARVVASLRESDAGWELQTRVLMESGAEFLARSQNSDGGFGGRKGLPSTVEETALSLSALTGLGYGETARRATTWLLERIEAQDDLGLRFEVAPIGLYFARLWYSEELYPVIACVEALRRVKELEGYSLETPLPLGRGGRSAT